MRRTAITALVALMVALAGCGATTQGALTTTQTDDATNAIEPTSGTVSDSAGTIAFYVSDQPAAIEDFEHLNVTIEKIGLKPAGADDDEESSDAAESDDDESEDENGTTTTVTTTATTTNETTEETTNTSTTTTTESPENETTEAPENQSEDDEAADEQDDEEREGEEEEGEDEEGREEEGEEEQDDEDDEKAGWVTYDVDNRTVDLTELQGENATRLANLSAPSGTYTTVFVYVSDVHGVLENGEEVRVKLPSQKLQLHTTFEIGANASTDFVYDIAVHKAGNSGKYILKPNIAESGTDVPIRDIDREREHEGEMGEHDEDMDEHDDEEMGEHDDEMNESESQHPQNESEMGEGHDGNGMDEHDGNGMDDHSGDGMQDESAQGDGEPGDGADHDDRFSVALDGNVTAGGTVTVSVTNARDKAVSGAAVSVNGDSVGETDGDGQIEITVPEGAEELEITVRTPGGAEIELERSLEG